MSHVKIQAVILRKKTALKSTEDGYTLSPSIDFNFSQCIEPTLLFAVPLTALSIFQLITSIYLIAYILQCIDEKSCITAKCSNNAKCNTNHKCNTN